MQTTQIAAQNKMNLVRTGILLLGLATAFIHLQLHFPDPMFILNGLGYLGLLASYFLPIPFFRSRHYLVRWALVAFTAVTLVSWVFMGERSTLAYGTKAIEVLLIILLSIDRR